MKDEYKNGDHRENDKNFRDDEKLNFAPEVKPFSRIKIVELSLCAVAVILGLVYLNTELIDLGVLLIIYSCFFVAIPILRGIDVKKNGGGFVALLPALCWGFLSLCVIAATVAYFIM